MVQPEFLGLDVNRLHDNDDLDGSSVAHHHTLGKRTNQAATGTHGHTSPFIQYFPTISSHNTDASLGSGGSIDAWYNKIGQVNFECFIRGGTGATWGTGGGTILGLLPVPQKRAFTDMWFSIFRVLTVSTWNLSLAAAPDSAHHDPVDGAGNGLIGAFGAGVIYIIRGTYEGA